MTDRARTPARPGAPRRRAVAPATKRAAGPEVEHGVAPATKRGVASAAKCAGAAIAGKRTAAESRSPGRLLVRVTHPDKPYWPDDGLTKLDLIRFYARVFDRLRPYLRDRLLSLERCPEGMLGDCFYQKEAPAGLPPDTPTKRIEHDSRVVNYVVAGKRETQLALANLGCIAIHVWGSRAAAPRRPDWVCFDLDPMTGRFSDAARAGLKVKAVLDALDLESFPKTSGGRGMHVFVPIKVGPDAGRVREFAIRLSTQLARAYPSELTVEGRIAARGDRVYLDSFRNGYGQTVVAPYSVRCRAKAPVSTPLDWSEVDPALDPTRFNITTFADRLAAADPWAGFFRARQSLEPALRAVTRLG